MSSPVFVIRGTSFVINGAGLALTIGEFSERHLRPAYRELAHGMWADRVGFRVTTLVWHGGRYREALRG